MHMQKREYFYPYLAYTGKINSKWMVYANVKPITISLLRENSEKIFVTLGYGKILDIT